ncbi:hypothetical protein [Bradyrhizobium iriomotense]|uniref:Uncharacterized protein n=1 Tax=Bradyrhizobium iriomotense TaxID=441950 RepID=A0ABQ6B4T5_9BRAD|nr:hypothetical protein [Bradyrhizobium iriomotense]GLR87077.1 hypothetical protein GCM10007857_37880 [Bradyrhizobium iriomotense]
MFVGERSVLGCVWTPGSVGSGISMTSYSLIKVGNDYVVQADDKCILKVASRRRAAQLISEATGLLNAAAAVEAPEKTAETASLHRETPKLP